MPFEINETRPTQYTVAVTVEPGMVRQKRSAIFREVKEHAQLPGFRPGKIPAKIIEKRFHQAIEEKLKDDLIRENVSQFFRETKLHIIGQPRLKEPAFNLDESFTFTIDLDVIPEFELAEYKSLEIEKSKIIVSDEEVESQLLELQKRNTEYCTLTEDRPVRKDDHVIIDFKGRVDLPEPQKSKMEERMYGEAYALHIGSNTFVPGFEEGLIGMKKNESKELEITFPEGYQQDALAGKKAFFDVTVKEIKIEKLLPIDDEFAKDFGDFETLAELKQKISDDIKNYKESLEVNRIKALLKERLVDLNSGFEIPALLVEEQIDRFTRREAYMYPNKKPGVIDSKEEREKYRKMAEREARAMIVLSKIANKERLSPSEEEMDQRVAEFAMSLGKKAAEILPSLEEKGYIDSIAAEISEEKALNFVLEHAEITEVEPQEPAETAGEK